MSRASPSGGGFLLGVEFQLQRVALGAHHFQILTLGFDVCLQRGDLLVEFTVFLAGRVGCHVDGPLVFDRQPRHAASPPHAGAGRRYDERGTLTSRRLPGLSGKAPPPRQHPSTGPRMTRFQRSHDSMVPAAGLEPARPKARDFKSLMSTIPPRGPRDAGATIDNATGA